MLQIPLHAENNDHLDTLSGLYQTDTLRNFLTWRLLIFPDVASMSNRTSRDWTWVSDWIKFAAGGSSRVVRASEAATTSPTLLCKFSAEPCSCCQWVGGKTESVRWNKERIGEDRDSGGEVLYLLFYFIMITYTSPWTHLNHGLCVLLRRASPQILPLVPDLLQVNGASVWKVSVFLPERERLSGLHLLILQLLNHIPPPDRNTTQSEAFWTDACFHVYACRRWIACFYWRLIFSRLFSPEMSHNAFLW